MPRLPSRTKPCLSPLGVLALSLSAAACTGVMDGATGMGAGGAQGNSGASASGGTATSGGQSSIDPGKATTDPVDPGRVDMHRLSSTEYNATVTDVLGTTYQPADGNWRGGELGGFDNMASVLGVDADQYQRYFEAAEKLLDEAFASDALRAKVMPCVTADDACLGQILDTTGTRIFRRPLTTEELATYEKVYDASQALGDDHTTSVKTVVRALLSSAEFLYRIELDERPDDATTKHPLNAFELASRLSYFLWSSAPDDQLLAAASDSSLLEDAVLGQAVDYMLRDAKSNRFTASFAGQWLGARRVVPHPAAPDVYPSWNPELADAAAQEMYLYFDEFLRSGRTWLDFMKADINFVTPALAEAYGMPVPAGATPTSLVRVENVEDGRRGFAGLIGFLAMSSPDRRSAPTLRGKWLLLNLMCTTPPEPPPGVPLLEQKGDTSQLNVRQVLEEHRANPACAACHSLFDPFGLALEQYDGIGKFRTTYPNGSPIDPATELAQSNAYPDGLKFSGLEGGGGLPGVADAVTQNPRFATCVSEKMLSYGLGRLLTENDRPYLELVAKDWLEEGQTPNLTRLVHALVTTETFRSRRGGT
jgi:Protein of unknown function (DUF1592)/Protein of unknown function (DUF1588)/Protein of unknown function (DUF1595)/Protein of unknown function (DUF1587)/Protein of unknown function (DUF1585)